MAKVSFTKQTTSYTTDEIVQLVADRFDGGDNIIRMAAVWENETILLLADSTDAVLINLDDTQPVFSVSSDCLTSQVRNSTVLGDDRKHYIWEAFNESYLGNCPLTWQPVELVACELRYI
ncbi:hypothetical protein AVV29_gp060 [Vibrio phage phi 3]|uniref:Uncharacterized protein n=1 Tax=Vibrio phage phi 3 TaxID=1589298 RepID=A0A0B5H933_9CAUD|nr:hypothetical protein AVV29_gp006 [Vibrio phage phi 3]YP_009207616.1 hypothetical protein AVV29_gp060 [Vibrio phage phi 3]AJF40774.1 hypothetical protein SBVP3_0006 [Vibrio phage phi 3]AJF40918.1 hypothetical protein SBVP3_00151 [Vibrio phage phi 3]